MLEMVGEKGHVHLLEYLTGNTSAHFCMSPMQGRLSPQSNIPTGRMVHDTVQGPHGVLEYVTWVLCSETGHCSGGIPKFSAITYHTEFGNRYITRVEISKT